jgi:hypothetical protein
MRYAYVEDGKIVEGPKGLPPTWRNVSGFDCLSDDELLALGWFPWIFIETVGDVITGSTIEILPTQIIETQTRRNKTEAELQDEQQQRFAQECAAVRSERNELLSSCDWTQLADAPVDNLAWAVYRQELRDIPSQSGFPWSVTWPTRP